MTFPDDRRPASPPPPPPGFGPQPASPPPPPPYGPAPSAPAYGQPPAAPAAPNAPTPYPPAPGFAQPVPGYTAYGTAPVTSKPPRPSVTLAAILLLAGGALTILGCALTWFEANGVTVTGFTTFGEEDVNDGPFFTFMAVLLIAFGITFLAARRVFVLAIIGVIAAGIVILAGIGDYSDVRDFKEVFGEFGDISIGPGLPIVILGGLVSLAGSILALTKRRK